MEERRMGWDVWKKAFELKGKREPYWHMERSSSDGVCFCKCPRALVAVPDQLDCPWCGCGFLFSCAACGRAFTFAKPVRINKPLEQIIELDLLGRGFKATEEFIAGSVAAMREEFSEIEEDAEYVYLDGRFLPLHAENFTLEGIYAMHELVQLPHAISRRPKPLLKVLGDERYWRKRRVREEE